MKNYEVVPEKTYTREELALMLANYDFSNGCCDDTTSAPMDFISERKKLYLSLPFEHLSAIYESVKDEILDYDELVESLNKQMDEMIDEELEDAYLFKMITEKITDGINESIDALSRKIDELGKRVAELEKKPAYIPVYPSSPASPVTPGYPNWPYFEPWYMNPNVKFTTTTSTKEVK